MTDGDRKALWSLVTVMALGGLFAYDTTTAGDESMISNLAEATSQIENPIAELMEDARDFRAEMDARQVDLDEAAAEMDGFLVEAGND